MSVTVKVLNAKKEVARTAKVTKNNLLVLEAKTKENYQLVDDATGLAPQNIITKRQGKDLVISLNDGDKNPDILIKNYYDEKGETTNVVTGQHENGKIYAYIPESGNAADAISVLAEEVSVPQALGGEEIVGGLWVFNPWWLAAGALAVAGIAVAASSGSSKGGSKGNVLEKAKVAVKAAEDADKAFKDALAKANEDNLITPEEKVNLDKLKAEADKAKADADAAVKGLSANNKDKPALQGRVDALGGVDAPAVNDKDADGKADAQEKAEAVAAVEKAEQADKAFKDALAAATKDDLVTSEEKANLDKLKAEADKAKMAADNAVKGLPEGTEGKDSLQGRVDALGGSDVPAVNDKDADGKNDATELADAKAAVEVAEKLDEIAKKALEDAQKMVLSLRLKKRT